MGRVLGLLAALAVTCGGAFLACDHYKISLPGDISRLQDPIQAIVVLAIENGGADIRIDYTLEETAPADADYVLWAN